MQSLGRISLGNTASLVATLWCVIGGFSGRAFAAAVELTVTPGPTSTEVGVFVTGDDGVSPHIVRFVVYRKEFTGVYLDGCGPAVQVADLPRPSGTASYSFLVQDAPLPLGRAYGYWVLGMPGETLGLFDSRKSWVALTTGTALIAEGADVRQTGNGLGIVSCSCLAFQITLVRSAPSEIVDSNLMRRLYGRIEPRDDWARFELVVESGTPVDHCDDFAVAPSAWSAVKSLYR